MKLANALPTLLTALGLLWANVSSAAQMARFVSVKGKVRIEGTSNIDSWQIECKTVEGFLEAHSDFPLRTGQKNTPGPVDAHGEFFLEARALKSVERDGKPFS